MEIVVNLQGPLEFLLASRKTSLNNAMNRLQKDSRLPRMEVKEIIDSQMASEWQAEVRTRGT